MASGSTANYTLDVGTWTLIADGSAGVLDVIVQNVTSMRALLHFAAAAPSGANSDGIVLASRYLPFGRSMAQGQKLYAKALDEGARIAVMVGS